MRRMWIGAVILAALLAAGILAGAAMEKRVSPGAETLRQAAEAALAEDWAAAVSLTDAVREDWERVKAVAELLATHEELEQIEISFDQLRAYAHADGPAYSALCAALARQLDALGKAHGCSPENIF